MVEGKRTGGLTGTQLGARLAADAVAGVAEVRGAEAEPHGQRAAVAALPLDVFRPVRGAVLHAQALRRAAAAAHDVLGFLLPVLLRVQPAFSQPGLLRFLAFEAVLECQFLE